MPDFSRNIAVLFLLPQCNMTCSFCITRDGFQVMTEAEARSLIVALESKGVRNLIFGGGEPLCWPHDLLATARFAKEHGMFVQVGTNGIALTDALLASAAIDRFILPLESAEAAIHDSLRHHRGGGPALDPGKEAYRRICRRIKASHPGLPILMRPDMQHSATVGFFWMDGGAVRCRSPFCPLAVSHRR